MWTSAPRVFEVWFHDLQSTSSTPRHLIFLHDSKFRLPATEFISNTISPATIISFLTVMTLFSIRMALTSPPVDDFALSAAPRADGCSIVSLCPNGHG